jgi:hypothetical protein
MFCYDGASMTVRLVSHKAWDDDCPMHENWSPIVVSPLTNLNTLEEVFIWIKENITEANAEIVLRNQAFVDFIEDRVTGEKYNVMLPESEVPAFIEDDEVLRTKPMGQFYQHTIRNINAKFTHMDLTLRHLGIPTQDVIHVRTSDAEYYIELVR